MDGCPLTDLDFAIGRRRSMLRRRQSPLGGAIWRTMAKRHSRICRRPELADARLAAFQRGDVKTVLGMYRDDAVIITPEGNVKGAAISAMMVALFDEFAQPGVTFEFLSRSHWGRRQLRVAGEDPEERVRLLRRDLRPQGRQDRGADLWADAAALGLATSASSAAFGPSRARRRCFPSSRTRKSIDRSHPRAGPEVAVGGEVHVAAADDARRHWDKAAA